MAFRFFRRMRIAPGITLNLSKSGPSLSVGPRGAKMTVGPRGKRLTAGLPGTGLHYTKHVPHGAGSSSKAASGQGRSRGAGSRSAPPPIPGPDRTRERLTLSTFQRVTVSSAEQALVDGLREMAAQNDAPALAHMRKAAELPDGAFMAGLITLKQGAYAEAAQHLETAKLGHRSLGTLLQKYGIQADISLPITEHISAIIQPGMRGALLAQTEAYQGLERPEDALRCLQHLRQLDRDDPVVLLSFVELLLEVYPENRDAAQRVVRLTKDVENDSEIHAALLLYKAQSLRILGLHDGARETLTPALRRTKDRPPELLRALRYERALAYEALGQERRARTDLERIYTDAPGYEDVAQRLGL